MSTILVVEDDAPYAAALAAVLKREGFEVITADDGHGALAQLGQRTPDLVLLDIAMPQMDGVTLLRALRADRRWGDLPVVLLTALTDVEIPEDLNVAAQLLKGSTSLKTIVGCVKGVLLERRGEREEPGA